MTKNCVWGNRFIPIPRSRQGRPIPNHLDLRGVICYHSDMEPRKPPAMKALFPLLCTIFSALVIFPCCAAVLTFDDLPLNTDHASLITNGYHGLVWSNFWASNAILFTGTYGSNGYYNGMVSVSNVTFNGFGAPSEIDSTTNFNFLSAYLTGAWNSNLNIEVQGFSGGNLLYDQTVVVSATNPIVFTFNYLNVDRLYFNSFGGQYAGFPSGTAENFVMDNFSFEFVPEPSSFLLTAAGALTLWAAMRRKRP